MTDHSYCTAANTSFKLPWALLPHALVAREADGNAPVTSGKPDVFSGAKWDNRMDRHWVCM